MECYSFALYDKKESKLFLHKDGVGKKPLYYFKNEEYIVFSSNITAIKDNINDHFDYRWKSSNILY